MRLSPLALVPLLLLSGCRKPSATGLALDGEFSKIVGSDIKALVGLDLKALQKTPFYQRHQGQLNLSMLDNTAAQIGLDPRRDLAQVLLVWNGQSLLIGGKGQFVRQQIGQKLKRSGAIKTAVGEYTAYRMGDNGVAFLNDEHLLAGEWRVLKPALELYANGTASVPDELRERLAAVPKTAQIWEVSRGGLPFAEIPMRSEYRSALSNIANFVSSTNVDIEAGTGLELHGTILCISDAGAKRVNDALRGGIGLARLTAKDDEGDLLHLYDAIQVKQTADHVNLEASVGAELADRVITRFASVAPTSR